jgi:hypothetical protein
MPAEALERLYAHSENRTNATTNLTVPLSNWTVLTNITEISPGRFQFADAQTTNSPQRFYRVRSP